MVYDEIKINGPNKLSAGCPPFKTGTWSLISKLPKPKSRVRINNTIKTVLFLNNLIVDKKPKTNVIPIPVSDIKCGLYILVFVSCYKINFLVGYNEWLINSYYRLESAIAPPARASFASLVQMYK